LLRFFRPIVVCQNAIGRSIQVIILAIANAPQECTKTKTKTKTKSAQRQSNRYEKQQYRHAVRCSSWVKTASRCWVGVVLLRNLNAKRKEFAMTIIDDVDMAIAAIRGDAKPSMDSANE
jgi:hypothetical protein